MVLKTRLSTKKSAGDFRSSPHPSPSSHSILPRTTEAVPPQNINLSRTCPSRTLALLTLHGATYPTGAAHLSLTTHTTASHWTRPLLTQPKTTNWPRRMLPGGPMPFLRTCNKAPISTVHPTPRWSCARHPERDRGRINTDTPNRKASMDGESIQAEMCCRNLTSASRMPTTREISEAMREAAGLPSASWTFSGGEAKPEEEMTDNGSPKKGISREFQMIWHRPKSTNLLPRLF